MQYCGTGNSNIQYFVQLVNSVVGINPILPRGGGGGQNTPPTVFPPPS